MQHSKINSETVSVAEAAIRLGLSRDMIYTFVACGGLKSERVSGRIAITEESLGYLIEGRRRQRMAAKPRHLRLVVNNGK